LTAFDEKADKPEKRERRVGARRAEPTEEQRAAFEERLLDEDIEGARLQAMSFAMDRLRNKAMARQAADDAFRLCWERCTWDPKKVELGEYLCGVVRSEWSNLSRAGARERERAQGYHTERETLEGPGDPSIEQAAIELEESAEGEDEAVRTLSAIKAHFEKTGDTVNLERMGYMAGGIDSPAEMAKRSGRPVEDFYRAADRCARLVRKLRARDEE
jgi:DNA-directed RNA polymerase specialized sigma24 family protein